MAQPASRSMTEKLSSATGSVLDVVILTKDGDFLFQGKGWTFDVGGVDAACHISGEPFEIAGRYAGNLFFPHKLARGCINPATKNSAFRGCKPYQNGFAAVGVYASPALRRTYYCQR